MNNRYHESVSNFASKLDKNKIIALVKEVVAGYYGEKNYNWRSRERTRPAVKMKYVAIYAIRTVFPNIPLKLIGEHCGH